MDGTRIVLRPEILSESFVPRTLRSREEQAAQLRRCLGPALKGRKPVHSLLQGPSGVGKTLVAKLALAELKKAGVRTVYVNCWISDSFHSIVEQATRQLDIPRTTKPDRTLRMNLLGDALQKHPVVVALDSIDRLSPKEQNSILYNLSETGNVGVICLVQNERFYPALQEQVRSRFYPTFIKFPPYSAAELMQMIDDVSKTALRRASLDAAHFSQIAAQSYGNARLALEIIRKAAAFAEQDSLAEIQPRHINLASVASNNGKRGHVLTTNIHFRMIHHVVKSHPQILSGALWKTYLDQCREENVRPVANRTFVNYLKKLAALSLITYEHAGMHGNVRRYRILD